MTRGCLLTRAHVLPRVGATRRCWSHVLLVGGFFCGCYEGPPDPVPDNSAGEMWWDDAGRSFVAGTDDASTSGAATGGSSAATSLTDASTTASGEGTSTGNVTTHDATGITTGPGTTGTDTTLGTDSGDTDTTGGNQSATSMSSATASTSDGSTGATT